MKGKSTFEFVTGGLYEEIRGKSTFEFAAGGLFEEIRGKSTFGFAGGGLCKEMRGINTSEFGFDGLPAADGNYAYRGHGNTGRNAAELAVSGSGAIPACKDKS